MTSVLGVPSIGLPVEPYASQELQASCDPVAKPGTAAFRAFVLGELGGRDLGIDRPCAKGGASEHKEGRAWDWGMRADDPEERAKAEALLAWLLATDPSGTPHALFRRSGLMYAIWDRRIWSARTRAWTPYTGESPHTDHVHFSFGWPGALGQTSFFQWLRGEAPPAVAALPRASPSASPWSRGTMAILGAAVGWYGVRLARAAWSRR